MRKRWVFELKYAAGLIFSLGVLFFAAEAQIAADVASPAADAAKRRIDSFEKVWSTVNDKHYDPTFGGVDWASVKVKYEPLARAAKNDDELHDVLRKMLAELKLSHFGIHSGNPEFGSGAGEVGVELKSLRSGMTIFRVDLSSAAAKSGLKPGMIITSIDGKTSVDMIEKLESAIAGRDLTEGSRRIYRERMFEAALGGKPGSEVKIGIQELGKEPRTVSVTREEFAGEYSQPLGNFPAQPMKFESRRLEGNIGYISFNMWVIAQMPKLRAAMREHAEAAGIIIDLRGNPGGVGGMASGLAGMMLKEELSLGSMRSRESGMKFSVFPQPGAFNGPVAVLIDHGSGSTSEIFAAGLQDAGRITLIGERTAGAVLPSFFEKLPTGATFQYAVSDYRSPKDVLVEGRGVEPDIKAELDGESLAKGIDSQLQRAVEVLLKKGK
ncbi:MAG: PDZ domain-containing protein [Acidobacteria bacterium]|nr:PDZ domain-containing protein [Acidobacteriota bacterium]